MVSSPRMKGLTEATPSRAGFVDSCLRALGAFDPEPLRPPVPPSSQTKPVCGFQELLLTAVCFPSSRARRTCGYHLGPSHPRGWPGDGLMETT